MGLYSCTVPPQSCVSCRAAERESSPDDALQHHGCGPGHGRSRPGSDSRVVTAGSRAATIRTCRCGDVRTARHPRPRPGDAGSAIDRPPPAVPAVTSVARSPGSSATAGSTVSAGPCRGTRSAPAGRRRTRPSLRRRHSPGWVPPGRWNRTQTERTFERSGSSRSSRARHPRASPSPSSSPPPAGKPVGACGATSRPEARGLEAGVAP